MTDFYPLFEGFLVGFPKRGPQKSGAQSLAKRDEHGFLGKRSAYGERKEICFSKFLQLKARRDDVPG